MIIWVIKGVYQGYWQHFKVLNIFFKIKFFQVPYVLVSCLEFVNRHVCNDIGCVLITHYWTLSCIWKKNFVCWNVGNDMVYKFLPNSVCFSDICLNYKFQLLQCIFFWFFLMQVSQSWYIHLSWLFCCTSILLLTFWSLIFLSIQLTCYFQNLVGKICWYDRIFLSPLNLYA